MTEAILTFKSENQCTAYKLVDCEVSLTSELHKPLEIDVNARADQIISINEEYYEGNLIDSIFKQQEIGYKELNLNLKHQGFLK